MALHYASVCSNQFCRPCGLPLLGNGSGLVLGTGCGLDRAMSCVKAATETR
jgi:hypothetical protein